MRLNKIEIKGFKSFGDKTTINFNKGVTGIVGPNGCGKSNIVDAIRWVLGEQKTSLLRSDKMENIIFNGSKSRKKLQLAEVSISFDNTKNLIPTEYATVTVTRKYFRSGDSEYLLNDVKCRLKDITNLFLDTGISSNNYAIIELSMVDNILNDKDNSRLSLFEEAAGISKFRKRKKETFNKIKQTESDLDRVEDLVYEIEKNLRSLKRQAKQTEKYYLYKEEYKNISINVALKNSESSRKSLETNKIKLGKIEDENTKVSSELAKKNAAIESSKSSLIPYEKKLQSKQESLNKILDKIRDHEELIRIKAEKSKLLNESVSELKRSIKFDQESNERSQFSITSIDKEVKIIKKNIEKTLDKLDLNKKEYLKYEEKLKNQNIKISDIKDVETQFQGISNNIKNITSKKSQIVKLISLEKIDKSKVIKNLNSLEVEITLIDKSFNIIEELFRADNKETIRINKLFSDKSKDLSTTEIDYNNLKSKLESLEKELEYKSITYDFNKKRINKNQLKLNDSENEIKKLSSIDDEKDNVLIKLYDDKSISENDLENYENEYYKIKSNIDLDDTSVRELQKKKDINVELIDQLKSGIYDTELDLNSINQRISVEFDLKLSECKVDKDLIETHSIENLELRRDKLKEKIEKIGQINPLAMEAYKEINERHEFIVKEREDLFEAKDSLLKTIQEIDLVAKESFLNSFEKIKDNFKTVFRSLFTEDDDCDLVINDPDNPLESSIEIMAKPKGKKPLTINQLSGGEKTLTATSLLFAIYLLKPAPFCVFDEVDAPLDDSNIDKFNKIINKFSSSSQFIIVTHNKRTMNNADIIYGITMPEQGVSKVVPVDLRNLKA
ncbi:MAG: chromosome segregation SMC family protein [Cytophagales bacterium]|tara:strand:- start:267 stop:2795 length:2529 start_codon:yes stop_codon:yes gene_type:complete